MRSLIADGQTRLHSWRRVREFAVPPSMIEIATARRLAGDWAGACAAAHIDVDLDLHTVARAHGCELTALLRADLRRLAPDLLRWHLPRVMPDGLLRPGLTLSLARYPSPTGELHLVARTPPARADAGQRISLALWNPAAVDTGPHPRPRPDRRFRLDLHQHLWAADRAPDLRHRSGADHWPPSPAADPPIPPAFSHPPSPLAGPPPARHPLADLLLDGHPPQPATEMCVEVGRTGHPKSTHGGGLPLAEVAAERGYAIHRWAAEAAILRAADGHAGPVTVRLGNGRRLRLYADGHGLHLRGPRGGTGDPVLPYAATWIPPDLELLHAAMITVDRLHPLVAEALATISLPPRPDPWHPALPGVALTDIPGRAHPDPAEPVLPGVTVADTPGREALWLVECCGETHRVGQVDGVLVPFDHDPADLSRELLLAALGGPPLPCLRAISTALRNPDCLDDVRARLSHGDHDGAAALVADLLGSGAVAEGELAEAFADATEGRIAHGLYRAGLAGPAPFRTTVPLLPRKDRAGRRGRHHRLPKRATTPR